MIQVIKNSCSGSVNGAGRWAGQKSRRPEMHGTTGREEGSGIRMAEQQIPAIMPSLVVSDVQATLDWFNRLGFQTSLQMAGPDGSIGHAEVNRGPEVSFMFGPATWGGTPGSTGMSIYINLRESVDAYHDQVQAAGITITDPLTDQFWGDRTFSVEHPDGYRIMFGQHVRDVSEAEMQAAMAQMAAGTA
jgi:PhnB protein